MKSRHTCDTLRMYWFVRLWPPSERNSNVNVFIALTFFIGLFLNVSKPIYIFLLTPFFVKLYLKFFLKLYVQWSASLQHFLLTTQSTCQHTSLLKNHQEQFEVQYRAEGHCSMQLDRNTDRPMRVF